MIDVLALITRRQWREHKLRLALTLIGITIGVAAFFAVLTANLTLVAALQTTVEKMAGKADIQVTSGESGFPENYLDTVRSTDGVALAEPAIEMIVKTAADSNLLVLGLDTASDLELHSDIVLQKDVSIANPMEFINRPDSIAVSQAFASENNISNGDSLEIRSQKGTKTLAVRGFFSPKGIGSTFGGRVAIMDLYAMQDVFGREGSIDRIDIKTSESTDVDAVINRLSSKLPKGLKVMRPAQRGKGLDNALGAIRLGMGLMSFLAVTIGVFLIFNSFFISINQRRKEIGILRALGVERLQVQLMFLIEAFVLGTVGSLLGIGLGYVLSIGAIKIMSVVTAQSYGLVTTESLPVIRWDYVAAAMLVGISSSIVGAWLPAREAAIASPVAALYNVEVQNYKESTSLFRTVSGCVLIALGLLLTWFAIPSLSVSIQTSYWILIMAGMVLLLPVFIRLGAKIMRPIMDAVFGIEGVIAVDAMTRAPRRSSATVGALMIGLSFVISNGTLIESQKAGLERTLDRSVNADFFVTTSDQIRDHTYHFSEELGNRVGAQPGIKNAEFLRVTSLDYDGQKIALLAQDMEGWLSRSSDALDEGEPALVKDAMAAGNGFFVSQNFAFLNKIGLGDSISLETPTGTLTRQVLGILEYYQSENGTVFLERKLYKAFWKDDSLDYILITVHPETNRNELRKNLEKAINGEQNAFIYSHEEYRAWVFGLVDQFFMLNYLQMLIAIIIAALGLINTIVISVSDRKREIGILRALGGYRNQIRKMILLEAVAISVIGIGTGIIAGLFSAYCTINISVLVVAGFHLPLRFPYWLILAVIPFVIAISLLSALLPARRAAAFPVAESIEYE